MFDPHSNKGRYPLEPIPQKTDKLPEFDFIRASGDCVCPVCGETYYKHPYNLDIVDGNGYPWLHVLCDGTLVKL